MHLPLEDHRLLAGLREQLVHGAQEGVDGDRLEDRHVGQHEQLGRLAQVLEAGMERHDRDRVGRPLGLEVRHQPVAAVQAVVADEQIGLGAVEQVATGLRRVDELDLPAQLGEVLEEDLAEPPVRDGQQDGRGPLGREPVLQLAADADVDPAAGRGDFGEAAAGFATDPRGLDDDPQIEESFELDAPSGKDGLPAGIQERGYDVLGDLVGDTDLRGCSVGQRLARYRRRKRFCSLFDHGHSAARLGTVPALPRRATAFPRRRLNLLGVNGPPGGPGCPRDGEEKNQAGKENADNDDGQEGVGRIAAFVTPSGNVPRYRARAHRAGTFVLS